MKKSLLIDFNTNLLGATDPARAVLCYFYTVNLPTMSTLLYTILGLTVGSTLHCAVRKEISPCTCRRQDVNKVLVNCERMTSFGEVVDALQDRFSSKEMITLKVTFSALDDMPQRSFQELNMSVVNLQLLHDNLRYIMDFNIIGLSQDI